MKNRFIFATYFIFSFLVFNSSGISAMESSSFAYFSGGDSPVSSTQRLRMNLYEVRSNSKITLADGTLSEYTSYYSNNLDGKDARKLLNPGLNISILRENTNIIIERRHTIEIADTISYKLWGTQKKNYIMEFLTNSFDPRLECVLEDKYLHTKTAIPFNDSTKVRFEVNSDPASADAFRFRVLFSLRSAGALPLTICAVQALKIKDGVQLLWKTENESNVDKYLIERSFDSRYFSEVAQVTAENKQVNKYQWIDRMPLSNGFYRISSLEKDGNKRMSNIMRIEKAFEQKITIFPNPATAGNIYLRMISQPKGIYTLMLVDQSGKVILHQHINFDGFDATVKLNSLEKVATGAYYLHIQKPGGEIELLKLLL